jgi:hypothetical protein
VIINNDVGFLALAERAVHETLVTRLNDYKAEGLDLSRRARKLYCLALRKRTNHSYMMGKAEILTGFAGIQAW